MSRSRRSRSWDSSSPADTEALAAVLAGVLVEGDVVWVAGELGTGKTTFVRGACRALGVTQPVASPTYTVGNRYRGADVDVSHLDLYRSRGVTEDEWGDLEPYFDGAIVFVEWPEAGAGVLPAARVQVTLRAPRAGEAQGDARLIELCSDDLELLASLAHPLP